MRRNLETLKNQQYQQCTAAAEYEIHQGKQNYDDR
jgi:hypothetical protein